MGNVTILVGKLWEMDSHTESMGFQMNMARACMTSCSFAELVIFT